MQIQLLCVTLIAILVCSSASEASAAKSNLAIKPGEYLKSDYIDMIEKAHSPYVALMSCAQPCVLTGIEGGWQASSFHEYFDCHGIASGKINLNAGEIPYECLLLWMVIILY